MLKLCCAFVGVPGSVFSVRVNKRDLVGHLMIAIKAENKYDLKNVDAGKLHHFLAKKGDAWLPDDDPAAQDLEEGKIHTGNSSQQQDWTMAGRQIHVLVVIPDRVGDSESEASTVIGKRKYVHSEVTWSQCRQLLNDLGICVEICAHNSCWKGGRAHGGATAQKYIEYVERNIGDVLVGKQLFVIGVEKDTNILSTEVPGREIELIGRTDLLILSDAVKKWPSEARYLPEVKMLIEVRRDVKPSHDSQVLSELIALDLLAHDPVVALLTDLKNEWLFYWVAEKINNSACICKAIINEPGEAFEVVKVLLAQTPTATEITLPCFQLPVKRFKLKKVLPGGEGGGIRECIEQYYDLASMLVPDVDMARAVATQITRSIPTLRYSS